MIEKVKITFHSEWPYQEVPIETYKGLLKIIEKLPTRFYDKKIQLSFKDCDLPPEQFFKTLSIKIPLLILQSV